MPFPKPFSASLFAAAILFLFPFGCRSAPGVTAGDGASFGPARLGGADFFPLPPACIETPLDMLQRLSAEYGARRFEVNAWVKADERGVSVELFNDLGADMGELFYDGRELRLDSAYIPRALRPEYAAADFQLCFYRAGDLRRALGGLRLELGRGAGGETRRLFREDTLLIEIEKRPGELRYVNHERGYSYAIRGDFPW